MEQPPTAEPLPSKSAKAIINHCASAPSQNLHFTHVDFPLGLGLNSFPGRQQRLQGCIRISLFDWIYMVIHKLVGFKRMCMSVPPESILNRCLFDWAFMHMQAFFRGSAQWRRKETQKPKMPTDRILIRKDVGLGESYIAATLVWQSMKSSWELLPSLTW
jgi:hypothetical protein